MSLNIYSIFKWYSTNFADGSQFDGLGMKITERDQLPTATAKVDIGTFNEERHSNILSFSVE